MSWLLEPPVSTVLGALFALAVPVLLVQGHRLTRRSTASPGHPQQTRWMVRGIRDWILAGALGCFAFGLWKANVPLLIFGAVFLGEEIVETGIMLLALRRSSRPQ